MAKLGESHLESLNFLFDFLADDLSAMAMVDNLSSNISDLRIDRRTNNTTLSNSRPNQVIWTLLSNQYSEPSKTRLV